jgi:uncharacterized protein (DUF1015 family)
VVAIAPFRALRYDAAVPLAGVTSPPHDCIAAHDVGHFLRADPRNVIRVTLPQPSAGEPAAPAGARPGPPTKHAQAAALLRQWVQDGTLRRDAQPAFYMYQVTAGPPAARRTMTGFFARIAVDPSGQQVHPHERTLERPTKDRLLLRKATETDVEPIWLLYRDVRGWVHELLESNAFDELARFTDEEGHEHRLWRVDRPEAVGEIVAQFEDRPLVIADGHHRYRTALEHAAETGRPEHASILACLVRDTDPGLHIEATHRLLHGLPFSADEAIRRAEAHWDMGMPEPVRDPLSAASGIPPDGCVLVTPGPRHPMARTLRLWPASELDRGRGRLDALAVTLVHQRLLADCWGIDAERPEAHVRYARDAHEAVQAVAAGTAQWAVLVPPEPVDAVLDVAAAGQLMPQKATYFVPKLRSGLVLSPLDEARPRTWQDLAGGPGKADFRRPPLS